MKVKVTSCWGNKYYYSLDFTLFGRIIRERVNAEKWDRKAATEALDILQLHGIRRQNVRFAVK